MTILSKIIPSRSKLRIDEKKYRHLRKKINKQKESKIKVTAHQLCKFIQLIYKLELFHDFVTKYQCLRRNKPDIQTFCLIDYNKSFYLNFNSDSRYDKIETYLYKTFRSLLNAFIEFSDTIQNLDKLKDDYVAEHLLNQDENKSTLAICNCKFKALILLSNELLKRNESDPILDVDFYFEIIEDFSNNIIEYATLKDFPFDFRWLTKMNRNPILSHNDRWSAINSLFWIGQKPMNHIHTRDVRPVVLILMRQGIELFLNNVIGFSEILNSNGTRAKKVTQIGYKFFEEHKEKQNDTYKAIGKDWDITFNIPVNTISLINKFTNSYTHNPYIPEIEILYFVYLKYTQLIGKSIVYPDVKINGIENLKRDFTKYLNKNHPDLFIDWGNIKQSIPH